MYLCIYNIVTGAQSHSGLCPRERLTGVGRARRNSIQPPASPGSPGGSGDGDRDVALVCLPAAGAAAVQALVSRNCWALLVVQGSACKRCAQAQNLQTHLAELQEAMERGRNIGEAGKELESWLQAQPAVDPQLNRPKLSRWHTQKGGRGAGDEESESFQQQETFPKS